MKTVRFNIIILLIIFQSVMGIRAEKSLDERTKVLKKEYIVTPSTRLLIDNKYGDVTIEDWDQDKVIIEVKIKIDYPDEERASRMMDYIQINFTESENLIEAVTEIDEKLYKTGSWFNFNGDDKEFSINYNVFMPKTMDVSIQNKYGSIVLNELSGKVNIDLKYGYLKADKLTRGDGENLNEVNLAYSKGSIQEVNWMKINLKYSQLSLDKGHALVLVTKYSKFYLDFANSIVAETKYDTYELGTINNFVVEAGYCDVRIDKITKKLDIQSKYSDFKVMDIPGGFESISIENSYGGINLHISPNASYKLNGEAKYAKIDHPESSNLSQIDENSSITLYGTIGAKQTASKVSVQTRYGNVKLY